MSATKVILSYPWQDRSETGPSGDAYLCCLKEEVQAIARKELREDELARSQAIRQFSDWIKKNKDLANCRTDANFLLRFLRVKKFSLPMAENMFLKYLNLRQVMSPYCMKLDFLHPPVSQLIDKGYLFPSPIRDRLGRKVILGIAANIDPHKYNCVDMAKVHLITYETLLDDEENQVMGFNHIGDLRTVSMSHVSLWSPTDFATLFKWGEHSMPMRHKEVHLLNVPSALKYVYDFCSGRLSQKIRDRFMIHSTLEELYSKVDPKVLPKEYGGTIPMADMIELWKQELAAKREKLLDLDKMKLLDNRSIMKRDKNNNCKKSTDINSLSGSFRKLEVD